MEGGPRRRRDSETAELLCCGALLRYGAIGKHQCSDEVLHATTMLAMATACKKAHGSGMAAAAGNKEDDRRGDDSTKVQRLHDLA